MQTAVIGSLEAFEQKQETIQLMKDMLSVNGDTSVLYDSKIDTQYDALKCEIAPLEKGSGQYNELEQYVLKSQVKSKNIKISSIYTLKRAGEWDAYESKLGGDRQLSPRRLAAHASPPLSCRPRQGWVGFGVGPAIRRPQRM